MSEKRVSETSDAEIRGLAAPRPVTCHEAEDAYRSTIDAHERFEQLNHRDLMARSLATLRARGEYDPQRHGPADKYEPLTPTERLELLAVGGVLARYYRHPTYVDHALKTGASWEQVAAAVSGSEGQARQDYREWAEGQHHLWTVYEGKFGMDDAEYATAIARTEEGAAPR